MKRPTLLTMPPPVPRHGTKPPRTTKALDSVERQDAILSAVLRLTVCAKHETLPQD
ncbi:MAG: hypothetical protein ACU0GG_19950 [Paracoccaceae bacterium]